MKKDRLIELLKIAIMTHEQDIQTFDYTEEEAHEILLKDFQLTDKEYKEIMKK